MPRMTTAELNAFNARRFKDYKPTAGATLKESELHADILAECRRRGWIAIHSRMDAPSTLLLGCPDFVVMAEGGKVFFVEAKTKTGKLSEAQRAVHAWAERLGFKIHVVRSMSDFLTAINPKDDEG